MLRSNRERTVCVRGACVVRTATVQRSGLVSRKVLKRGQQDTTRYPKGIMPAFAQVGSVIEAAWLGCCSSKVVSDRVGKRFICREHKPGVTLAWYSMQYSMPCSGYAAHTQAPHALLAKTW